MKHLALALLVSAVTARAEVGPVAIFHGINSHCPTDDWSQMILDGIDYAAVVKCVEIGDGVISSIFERMEWQVKQGCRTLRNDPDFAGKEINIVGLSQGGLIARSIVEQCEGLKVHTLFTYGGPHNGVDAYQLC